MLYSAVNCNNPVREVKLNCMNKTIDTLLSFFFSPGHATSHRESQRYKKVACQQRAFKLCKNLITTKFTLFTLLQPLLKDLNFCIVQNNFTAFSFSTFGVTDGSRFYKHINHPWHQARKGKGHQHKRAAHHFIGSHGGTHSASAVALLP
jgi:hypothetical protein